MKKNCIYDMMNKTYEILDREKVMNERNIKQRKRRRRAQIKRRIQLCLAIGVIAITLFTAISVKKDKEEAAEAARIAAEAEALLRQRIENAKTTLDTYYSNFLTANELELTVLEGGATFSNWLYVNYFGENAENLLNFTENQTLTDAVFYQTTGESMHVLSDRYQERISEQNQIYERKNKTAGEAEITIAGDLCFAEDGFVLDYYDTVNDLEKCISPYLLDIMNQSDLFYLNHEYCISDRGTPLIGKYYTFRAKPERMELLKQMGTDLVALANNHVYDYGEEALIDTTELLQEAGIPYVGGGVNIEEAKRPVYFIINGLKIGFVGASNAEKYRFTPQATETSAGILRAYDTTEYNQVIQEAAKECDYLIAYIHWGTEDSNYLNSLQQQMGREFLDSGADIVVGGHPHVLQGMEYVDGKPIVYSLGDFWFNSETKYTGLLQLRIDFDGLKEMSFVPCLQTNYTTQYIETTEEQEKLFTFLESLSPNIQIDENGIIHEK